jgi:hypothetical protein
MTEPIITCPTCRSEIPLTESLAAPLLSTTRREYERRLADKDREIAGREAAILDQRIALEQDRANLDARIAERLSMERVRIAGEEAAKAKVLAAADLEEKTKALADLREVLRQRDEKLAEAQKVQADLIRKQRELDDARRELELTIEKRVQESLAAIRLKAKEEAEEGLKLRLSEKEEQIASMQRQIEELRRKAEQGSQQLQGEVQELQLEAMLRAKFSRDIIEPVPKGEFGGDVVQRVFGPLDQLCGTILWESKRTKNWTDGWIAKLRDDQRRAKADMALIVSNALPKGVHSFDHVDGIWVIEPRCAIPVAIALRQSLIEIVAARQAGLGQQTKMELVYQYLTGPRFRQRLEAIVEKFSEMQSDLDKERKAMIRIWAKREAQIRGVVEAASGMCGDLQGIAGKAFPEIDGIALPLIDDHSADNQEKAADHAVAA